MIITKRRIYLTLLLVALAYILVKANCPVALATSSSTSLDSPNETQTPIPAQFTVATYNIQRSKGLDNDRDINRAVGVLRNAYADIIGLNELSGTLFYGLTDQAEQIGSALGFSWLFAPTYRLLFQDHLGNGLVSRWPVSSWKIYPLVEDETGKQTFRNMIVASVPMQDAILHIVITHLDRSAVRPRQLQQVLKLYKSLPEPAILLGDLNTKKFDPQMVQFFADSLASDAITVALGRKNRRLDWIMSRGLTVVSGGMQERGISDHPAYWVKFQLPGTSKKPKGQKREKIDSLAAGGTDVMNL
ncbi:MAG: endonuclease/exonuclease/phosphatase family protein [Halioglobus sp.]